MRDTGEAVQRELERTELECGVRVLSERFAAARSVSFGVWIDTGSRDESTGEHGLSHFTEHMLFKGTPGMAAREIAEAFDYLGADINAATGREHTFIYTRGLQEHTRPVIETVMEMARHSVIDPVELDSERKVVLEEINMHNDSPDEMVHDFLSRALWGDHPIAHSVLGDVDIINNTSSEAVRRFYHSRYVGSRMVVSAAGAVDHGHLCEMVESCTEGLASGEPSARLDSVLSPVSGKIVHRKNTEQAHISLGSKGLPRAHPDRFALSLLDNILGGSMSSRLFQRIREQLGLAYSIYSFSALFVGMGMVGIYCGTSPGQAQRVIELVEQELARAGNSGFEPEELERAKNQIKGSLLISNEDSGNRMNRIAKAELSGGEHLTVDEMVERIERVTAEDLDRVYHETWGAAGFSLAVVGPFEDDEIGLTGCV